MTDQGQPPALPLTVDEITPQWLTTALDELHPGLEVVKSRVVDIMEGSATKVRVDLTYSDATGRYDLPGKMVLKAGFNELMRQLAGSLYRNEVLFFRHAAPHLDVPLPRCFYAAFNDSSGQSVLLLEDLDEAGATYGHIGAPLSVEGVSETLSLLARVHAKYWGRAEQPPVSALTSGPDGQAMVVDFLLSDDNWTRCEALGRFEGLPSCVQDRHRVADSIRSVVNPSNAGPNCLVHGDAHLGNMYFDDDGAPRFLDWQAAGCGRWVTDVGYFIICALAPDDRRAHERDLLAHYLAELRRLGVETAPSAEDAWWAYRRQAVYGLLGLFCTPEMQSESFSRTMGARFAFAVDELQSLEAHE